MEDFVVLIDAPEELMPTQGNPGDAGYDIRASEEQIIPAGEYRVVKTGIKIAMPSGYVAIVHPRSGLAAKNGITVLNSPGTIDAGYRGEIMVTLVNHSTTDFVVNRLDRIAQLIFQKFETAKFVVVDELPGSQRGTSGFGSTGVS
ncbi:MAG: dUTP diphosphatase [Actinomycetota bacterium]